MEDHQLTPSDDSSNSQDINRKLNRSYSGGSDELSSGEQYTDTFFKKISRLNQAVSSWIKTQVSKNPLCDLTPIFKDYSKYLKDILDEFCIPSSPSNNHTSAHQLSIDQESLSSILTPTSVISKFSTDQTAIATTTIVTSTFISSTFTTSLSIASIPSIPSLFTTSIATPILSTSTSTMITSSFITRSLTTPSFTTASIPPLPSVKSSASEIKVSRFNPFFRAAPSHAATGQAVGTNQPQNTIPSAPPLKIDKSVLEILKPTQKDASSGQETPQQSTSLSNSASKTTPISSLTQSSTLSSGSIFKGLNFAHIPQSTQSNSISSIGASSSTSSLLPVPSFRNYSGSFNPISGNSNTTTAKTKTNTSENANSSGICMSFN